jgi:hypothetical protein
METSVQKLEVLMKIIKSENRGHAEMGWLQSAHLYSFGSYMDPKRMGLGQLRVLNDDWVAGGAGFGTHPHRDMEIISIPLSGKLHHKDSEGNEFFITPGEVQVMSAGTGILHSEFNALNDQKTNFLQIWVIPREEGTQPRYEQKDFNWKANTNSWTEVISPNSEGKGLFVNQDTKFFLGQFEEGEIIERPSSDFTNFLVFVIDGKLETLAGELNSRDSLEGSSTQNPQLKSLTQSQVLYITVN